MSSTHQPPTIRSEDPHRHLRAFGWSAAWEEAFRARHAAPLEPARVVEEHRTGFLLVASGGELHAECCGRLLADGGAHELLPSTGDWVAFEPLAAQRRALIQAVLPRRTCLARRAIGGQPGQQVIAANVDTVLIVCALDHDFHLGRLERYLVLVAGSGAAAVIVLNKSDLHPDPGSAAAQATRIAGSAPVVLASAHSGAGLADLGQHLATGMTVAVIGSSGAGKSTLVNALMGAERQRTGAVRRKDHGGSHTTTSRVLLEHADGWALLDTPGIREVGLAADASALDAGFADITGLAPRCRFRDCAHRGEPGCAIAAAVEAGTLDARRLANFHKLARELAGYEAHLARKARAIDKSAIQTAKRARRGRSALDDDG